MVPPPVDQSPSGTVPQTPRIRWGQLTSRLPAPLTSLVGREREVAALVTLLRRDDVRLITLTGPGGIGKTRLAIDVAANVAEDAVGVYFVGLASVANPELVAPSITHTLGISDGSGQTALERLQGFLQGKNVLLVLDNFEHLLEAAPSVAQLLAACPRLKVLVTSRAKLHVSGEHIFLVPALPLPDLARLPGVHSLAHVESIRLFVERATAAQNDFALTEDNSVAVASICHRLDGLPLGIELAAARLSHLPPLALLARLERRLPLLTGGGRDQPVRLQTLWNAIAWSFDLLAPREQRLFRRLAVFASGFSLDAAEYVGREDVELSADSNGAHPVAADQASVLDLLAALVEQSLLTQEEHAGSEPRFRMLETIREFALEQLAVSGEEVALRERHATWFATLAEEADVQLRGHEQLIWLTRLETEHDNLRAALTWALAEREADLALRLTGGLHWFWFQHGHWSEGRVWLERALSMPEAQEASPERARALAGLGVLNFVLSDYENSRARLYESINVSREASDDRGQAYAVLCLVWPTFVQGDYAPMGTLAAESLTRFQALNDRWGIVAASCSLGIAEMNITSNIARPRALFEESLAGATDLGDCWSIARAANCLGELARAEGDYDRATEFYSRALALFQALGQSKHVPLVLHNLGQAAAQGGHPIEGATYYAQALARAGDLNDRRGQALNLAGLAAIAAVLKQGERSAQLFGAADALLASTGAAMEAHDVGPGEQQRSAALAQLGSTAFAQAWEVGAALPPQQAIREALAFVHEITVREATTSSLRRIATSLSRREEDVLRLLVEGHSNPQIAQALFISRKTVEHHVTSILAKLGVPTRSAAVAVAMRDGLIRAVPLDRHVPPSSHAFDQESPPLRLA